MVENSLKYIKLKLEIPKNIWIYNISKKFPEETFILNYSNPLSKNERQVFLSTISKKNISKILLELKSEKGVSDIELFGQNIKLIFKLNFLQEIIHHKFTPARLCFA